VVGLFVAGWAHVVTAALSGDAPVALPSERIALNPLSAAAPPPTAFLLDAALRRIAEGSNLYGESGAVRIAIDSLPPVDSLPAGAQLEYAPTDAAADTAAAPSAPGFWNVILRLGDAARAFPDLSVARLVPLSEKRGGRIGTYRVGDWPFERGGSPPSPAYRPPRGLIRVTPGNRNLLVSEHFRLGDLLTKGQQDVWPKYVALDPRMLDKVELVIDTLEAMGYAVHNAGVISGFRTPTYNVSGGNPAGRGELSRHMYGDAIDFFIDNDRDGRMDDLTGDGRVTVADARLIADAAERVERAHPRLIGGIGVYAPTSAHSGFVHVDTRGYRARW